MDNTIEVKKSTLLVFISSIILAGLILFYSEHFGEFSFLANPEPDYYSKPSFISTVKGNTPVTAIYYKTFFGNKIQTSGNGFNVGDVNLNGSEFNKYETKLYYYLEAMKADYLYGIIMSVIIFILLWIAINIKIKLT